LFTTGKAIVDSDIFENRDIYDNNVEDNLRIIVNVPRYTRILPVYT